MQATVLVETEAFITKQRETLLAQRQELVSQQQTLQAQIDELDVMLTKFDVFEGKQARRGRGRRTGGGRRGSRRDELLKLITGSKGLTRGEILEKMALKGNKPGEMSVSNALTALTKSKQVARKIGNMWPHDPPSKPAKIPDDLWDEIQRTKERMLTFLADAQHTAEDEERAGTFDSAFYAWLEPVAIAVQQMQAIKRNGPYSANVVPFDLSRSVRG